MPKESPSIALLRAAVAGAAGALVFVLVRGFLEGESMMGVAALWGALAAGIAFPFAEWVSWQFSSRVWQGIAFGGTAGGALAILLVLFGATDRGIIELLIPLLVGGVIFGLFWKSKTYEKYQQSE